MSKIFLPSKKKEAKIQILKKIKKKKKKKRNMVRNEKSK